MKTKRLTSREKGLSGMAVALVYLIALQSIFASLAQATLAAQAGPLAIICTASGIASSKHAPDGDAPADETLRWHCATLCQVSSAGAPALPDAPAGAISAPLAEARVVFFASDEIMRPSLQRLLAEARAPPVSI